MSTTLPKYDIIIVGGGLAGLSHAILSAKSGRKVLVIEKDIYPRMKVCGEYISNESRNFLKELGLPIEELQLPEINQFVLTTQLGDQSNCTLQTGGIGISRYFLDEFLAKQAQDLGVNILLNTKVNEFTFLSASSLFSVTTSDGINFKSPLAILAAGRNVGFLKPTIKSKQKFVGVKYHISEGPPDDTIEIHHFEGGYCGVSKVEDNKYCLCYLVKAHALKPFNGDFKAFEEQVLSKNPFLKVRLQAPKLTSVVTTSNIQFGIQEQTQNSIIDIGDSAGFIPPITGNGMSLAFRSAKKLHQQTELYLDGKINLTEMLANAHHYKSHYLKYRINKGIFLQKLLFLNNRVLKYIVLKSIVNIPGFIQILSKQAVGKEI